MIKYQLSESVVEKIKEFEGLRLKAYQDSVGVWTIGYGHTEGVKAGMTITKAQAEVLLLKDLKPCENYVNSLGVAKNANQYAALVDFCFNLGTGRLSQSTLLKKIRQNRPSEEIQNEFGRWIYAAGIVLQGLVDRRQWESEMWVK